MKAFFVTGTGTEVGKTFVSGALLNNNMFTYWKPVQTGAGAADGDDTAEVWRLAGRARGAYEPLAEFSLSASPDQAAAAEERAGPTVAQVTAGLTAVLARIAGTASSPDAEPTLIVEGAGGLLVPLNAAGETWADFLAQTRLPALVVASPALGTLNHTSLTLEALRRRGLPILGLVLSGPRHEGNEASLQRLFPDVPLHAFTDDRDELAAFVAENLARLRAADDSWLALDEKHVWHPYTQHRTAPAPLAIARARGVWLYLAGGERLFDGASSWWVNTIGHGRPEVAAAIAAQQQTLDHVIFAGATHAPAARVAGILAGLTGGLLPRVFFSDNGSTAVEIALKIAYQGWVQAGEPRRTRFISFTGSYHGDTFGAMAVAQSAAFHGAFKPLLFDTVAADLPRDEAGAAAALAKFEQLLSAEEGRTAGVIVEPLLQGAGGMLLHPPAFLRGLERLCRQRRLPLIFDEVFTGLGRVGANFAFQRAGVAPDLVCIAKGLTGGNLPLAATLAREAHFAAFLGDDKGKALLHGHSYTGNAIACAAAEAALRIFTREDLPGRARTIEARFNDWIKAEGARLGLVAARAIGGVLAFELPGTAGNDYHDPRADRVAAAGRSHGLFLRPLGNTVYLMPPLTVTEAELEFALTGLGAAVNDLGALA